MVWMFKASARVAVVFALLAGCSGEIEPERPALGARAIAERLCALGPRESGTPGARRAADWIASELDAAGIAAQVDAFADPADDGSPRHFCNVTAALPGTGRKTFLLLSHYDTKSDIAPDFIGANDGGSSTALLLALARWYRDRPREATLVFGFLDGEECAVRYDDNDGLWGSRRLAARLKASGARLDGVVLLDMVGDADLSLTIPSNSDPRMVAALRQAAVALGLRDRMRRTASDMIDDHVPFLQLGYPAIDIIDFEYGSAPGLNDYWHTPEDTVDKLSDETLDAVGALVIELLRRL